MSYTLYSGQIVRGNVHNLAQLCTKYQVWAKEEHGVSPSESLACWIINQPEKHLLYFESTEEVARLSKIGFQKSKGVIPDLSNIGNSPLDYVVVTLR